MMLVTKYLPSTVTEKNATKNILDGQTDRGKTVYPPPPSGSGGIISNLHRGPSIDASYKVSVHLAKRFQRRRFV
jgi:hypothetical protein